MIEQSVKLPPVISDHQHIDGQQHITHGEDWNVVKGKTCSYQATSPPKKSLSSPPQKTSPCICSNKEPNRFLSLSNLEGDSYVSAEEIASTTALVIKSTDEVIKQTSSGDQQKQFLSIHQLDKSVPCKNTRHKCQNKTRCYWA